MHEKCQSGIFMGFKNNFNLNNNYEVLIFGIHKQNTLMCSQLKYEPDEPHSF